MGWSPIKKIPVRSYFFVSQRREKSSAQSLHEKETFFFFFSSSRTHFMSCIPQSLRFYPPLAAERRGGKEASCLVLLGRTQCSRPPLKIATRYHCLLLSLPLDSLGRDTKSRNLRPRSKAVNPAGERGRRKAVQTNNRKVFFLFPEWDVLVHN